MTELIWEGKYQDGKKNAPVRITLPFQTIETVNESAADRARNLDLFAGGRETDWRNRLIWGDKKYVLPSLLPEFSGKINLIYIDPPFDTGADFSFTATIPDHPDTEEDETTSFVKQPSIIEQKAYRDTWGRGLDSYLQWFYETAVLLRDLLAEDGSIYLHLDWHVGHYVKCLMDEVFGITNFRNELIVKRRITKNLQRQFETIKALSWAHDAVLWYSKSDSLRFHPVYVPMETTKPEGYWHHFWSNADRPTMRYELLGITPKDGQWKWRKERALHAVKNYQKFLKEANDRSLVQYWKDTGSELEFIRLSNTGKVENWFPPADERIADTIWTDIHAYENTKQYPTEKHEELLERIIDASSNEGDLVLDCFCGSGTTAAVAEKLKRKWITCDLGRFAIHTTRKRLLGIPHVKPFVVQNLGKYERQAWQAAEFPSQNQAEDQREREVRYRKFILELYHAEPVSGYTWLHGLKSGRMVHVGAVDAPVTLSDVKAMAAEIWRAIGGRGDPAGKGVPAERPNRLTEAGIDVLGWEFAFELNELARQIAAEARVDVRFKKIPYTVLEKRAVEQGDIQFFELAALGVDIKTQKKANGTIAKLKLKDFIPPHDDVPQDVLKAITHWSQWIDYWAVDWNFQGDTFHNEWQTFRTRKGNDFVLETSHVYDKPGAYNVVIKVIDILGNDTTKTVQIKVE